MFHTNTHSNTKYKINQTIHIYKRQSAPMSQRIQININDASITQITQYYTSVSSKSKTLRYRHYTTANKHATSSNGLPLPHEVLPPSGFPRLTRKPPSLGFVWQITKLQGFAAHPELTSSDLYKYSEITLNPH